MKFSLIVLIAFIAIVSGQSWDQLRLARDVFHVVEITIHEYLLNTSGKPLDQRLQFAFQILLAAGSNVTAAAACNGIHQIASYVCNIAANGTTSSVATSGTTESSGSGSTGTGYRSGKINFPA